MASKIVHINPPINLSEEDANLYFPSLTYPLPEPIPKIHHNVLVTRTGICGKNFKILSDSVHDYKSINFLLYKIYLGNLILRKKISLSDENTYVILHNIWNPNHFHWLTESLQRLWLVKDKIENLVLLIPKNYEGAPLKSLEPFKFKEIIFFEDKTNFKVKNLLLPPNPKKLFEYIPSILNGIRTFYINYVQKDLKIDLNLGERIYLSRKKARIRWVVNESEITEVLEKYNFKTIYFEDYTFEEQIAIMSNAKQFISIHGAGLTNMLFMKAGGSVLELYKTRIPGFDKGGMLETDLPNPCFMREASVLNLSYLIQFCDPQDKNIKVYDANVFVDKIKLEENIKLMLKQ